MILEVGKSKIKRPLLTKTFLLCYPWCPVEGQERDGERGWRKRREGESNEKEREGERGSDWFL